MSTFTVTRIINAPKNLVWEKLADFGNISMFHPMVARSHLIGGETCVLGAKRVCEFYGGKDRAEEEITSWREGQVHDGFLAQYHHADEAGRNPV